MTEMSESRAEALDRCHDELECGGDGEKVSCTFQWSHPENAQHPKTNSVASVKIVIQIKSSDWLE